MVVISVNLRGCFLNPQQCFSKILRWVLLNTDHYTASFLFVSAKKTLALSCSDSKNHQCLGREATGFYLLLCMFLNVCPSFGKLICHGSFHLNLPEDLTEVEPK